MEQKKYQRGIVHSSKRIKLIIDARIDDIQYDTNSSVSDIIEKALIDGLFGRNKDAQSIIFNNLYTDSVKQTMIAFFKSNLVRKYNTKPLVEFLLPCLISDTLIMTEENHSKFVFLFKEIIERLEEYAQQSKGKDNHSELWWLNYKHQVEWANKLYQQAFATSDQKVELCYCWQILCGCWVALEDYDITYTFLTHIATIAVFDETSTARNRLCDFLINVSEKQETEKESEKSERQLYSSSE